MGLTVALNHSGCAKEHPRPLDFPEAFDCLDQELPLFCKRTDESEKILLLLHQSSFISGTEASWNWSEIVFWEIKREMKGKENACTIESLKPGSVAPCFLLTSHLRFVLILKLGESRLFSCIFTTEKYFLTVPVSAPKPFPFHWLPVGQGHSGMMALWNKKQFKFNSSF